MLDTSQQRLREHQALTQPLAQLNDAPEGRHGSVANLPMGQVLERDFR